MDDAMPVLDPEQLAELRVIDGGKGAVFARLVDKFHVTLGARVQSIQGHALAGRIAELASEAHALKGSASNLGAGRLAALCAEIEAAARTGEAENAARLVGRLAAESETARAALAKEAGRSA